MIESANESLRERHRSSGAFAIEAFLLFGGVPLLLLLDLPRGVVPAIMLLALAYDSPGGPRQGDPEALVRTERASSSGSTSAALRRRAGSPSRGRRGG